MARAGADGRRGAGPARRRRDRIRRLRGQDPQEPVQRRLRRRLDAAACARVGVLWVDEDRPASPRSARRWASSPGSSRSPTRPRRRCSSASPRSSRATRSCCAPHPAGRALLHVRTVEVMAAAAARAGAPAGLVSCLEHATSAGHARTDASPRDRRCVLATGGAGHGARGLLVSGKPTMAVGAGNVPAYIHRSRRRRRRGREMIVTSKSFDNGTACVAEQVGRARRRRSPPAPCSASPSTGRYFLERRRSRPGSPRCCSTTRGALRPDAVGQSRDRAGPTHGRVRRPGRHQGARPRSSTRSARDAAVGRDPRPGAVVLPSRRRRRRLTSAAARSSRFGGEGHTLGLHADRPRRDRPRSSTLPASRIVVNTPEPVRRHGLHAPRSTRRSCSAPAPGAARSAPTTSRPLHLINIKRIAHEVAAVARPSTTRWTLPMTAVRPASPVPDATACDAPPAWRRVTPGDRGRRRCGSASTSAPRPSC